MTWGRDWRAWTPKFAWKPLRLVTGRFAWLQWVEVIQYSGNPYGATWHFNCRLLGTNFVAREIR